MAMEESGAAAVAELEADCQELRGMLESATRPSVRKELRRVLDMLEAELSRARGASAPATAPAAAPAAAPAPASTTTTAAEAPPATPAPKPTPKPAPSPPEHKPVPVAVKSAGPWTEITTFALDLGGYDKPTVTVDVRLKGVEQLPTENVTCDFTEASLDLKVIGLDGQNYRFLKTNLDKDIVPSDSGVKVKKNHVIVTLQKVKGEYGYDSWTDLCAKGRRKPTQKKDKGANAGDGIMDMMRDIYDEGDDNMKKIIGEAMYKAQRGEKYDPKGADMKMPSLDEKSPLDDI